MSSIKRLVPFVALAIAACGGDTTETPEALADDDPRHVRHEIMEDVGEAAKPLGQMAKGEKEYDVEVFIASMTTFKESAEGFGELFPEGTETGADTEAAPAIWEDRAGFDAALVKWQEATQAAIDARPETLEAAEPLAGAVFGSCKNCHDTYRIEDE